MAVCYSGCRKKDPGCGIRYKGREGERRKEDDEECWIYSVSFLNFEMINSTSPLGMNEK